MSDYLYRSKPQLVEGVHWTGDNWDEVFAFAGEKAASTVWPNEEDHVEADKPLQLLAGKDGAQEWVPVPVGHWLVRSFGDDSDIWPVDDAYFRHKYEEAGPR